MIGGGTGPNTGNKCYNMYTWKVEYLKMIQSVDDLPLNFWIYGKRKNSSSKRL